MNMAEQNLVTALAALVIAITPALVATCYSLSKRLDKQGQKIGTIMNGGGDAKIDARLREQGLLKPLSDPVPCTPETELKPDA